MDAYDHTEDVESVVLEWQGRAPVVVPAHTSIAQHRRLLTTVPPLDNILATLKQPVDKSLSLEAEADYNKTVTGFIKPQPRRQKVSKDDLLSRVCEPPAVTPSKRLPTRCVGPTAILNLVPAECQVNYVAANKTRIYRCQAARLVLVRNPAFCNKAYRSAATFRGPFCIVRKLFGNTTTLSVNGGTVRVDLAAAKDTLTRSVLSTLTDSLPFAGPYGKAKDEDTLQSDLRAVLQGASEHAVRAAISRALENGVSLAAALLANGL